MCRSLPSSLTSARKNSLTSRSFRSADILPIKSSAEGTGAARMTEPLGTCDMASLLSSRSVRKTLCRFVVLQPHRNSPGGHCLFRLPDRVLAEVENARGQGRVRLAEFDRV